MNTSEARRHACALELLKLGAVIPAQAQALAKMADLTPEPAVSSEDAKKSLERLKGLDTSSWSGAQARRSAAVGAVAAPVLSVAQRAIAGDPVLGSRVHSAIKDFKGLPAGKGGKLKALGRIGAGAVRNLAGSAAVGAATGGAMPVLKHEVEREAERGKLKKYIAQGGSGNVSGA